MFKKGYRLLLLFLIFLVVFLPLGCVPVSGRSSVPEDGWRIKPTGQDNVTPAAVNLQEKEYALLLYFLDPTEQYLFPLTIFRTTASPLQEAATLLQQGPPQAAWGKSPFPLGLYLRSIEVEVELNRVIIDLEATLRFQGFSAGVAEKFVKSVVHTLTSVSGIDEVEFLFRGKLPPLGFVPFSENIFRRADLILNPLQEENDFKQEAILLWFSDAQAMYMVPVSRKVVAVPADLETRALLLVSELLKGPGNRFRLAPSFPQGTEVLKITIDNRVAEINFNQALVDNHGGGTAGEWATLNSLVLTLTEMPEISKVQILIEGEKREAVFGHLSTEEPLRRGIINRARFKY